MARRPKQQDEEKPRYQAVLAAFNAWEAADTEGALLEELQEVQAERRELLIGGASDILRLATNRVLEAALRWQNGSDSIAADVVNRRFLDGQSIQEVALALKESDDYVNRAQRRGLEAIAKYLWQGDATWRERQVAALVAQLDDRQYSRLVGVDGLFAQVVNSLNAADDDWVVVIHGLGGIGKTALADKSARHVLESLRFDAVAMVRVQPNALSGRSQGSAEFLQRLLGSLYSALPGMPPAADAETQKRAIARRLKLFPHLVIIDNLEHEQDAYALLNLLGQWARPSKFLVTTRAVPVPMPSGPVAFRLVPVAELAEPDALTLLYHEAREQNRENKLATADADTLQPILKVTGGNPLALKLTVGLAQVLDLSEILEHLRRGQMPSVDEMYTRIYRAAWEALSRPACSVLMAMPFIGNTGATVKQLMAYTQLESAQVGEAVRELATRSLLEVRGTLQEHRYTIHRLTESFLEADVIGWKVAP